MNPELINRIKSLAWQTAMVALAAAVAYLATPQTLAGLGMSESVVIFLGLVLSQISKYLNNKLSK